MNRLEKIYQDTKKLNADYQMIIKSVMEQLEPDFVDMNKRQMSAGFDAITGRMPQHKEGWYKDYKERIGSQSLPYMDYKNTGTFHDSIEAITHSEGTEIFSTDSKAVDLEKRIDPERLYGVRKENLEALRQKAIDLMQKEIREAIGL